MFVDGTSARSFPPAVGIRPPAARRPFSTFAAPEPAPAAGSAAPSGELTVLGGFRLVLDGETIDVSVTGQRLVAALVCHSGSVARRRIAHLLWPDTTSARAHGNLRTVIYRLERTCPGLIQASGSSLRLADGLRVDLESATALANRILTTAGPLPAGLRNDALEADFYHDLLPELDDEWLFEYQDRYHQLRLTALETLSHRLAGTGLHGAAVYTALAVVHADSLRDSAHQTLIRACLVQGNRQEALSYFADYQRIFRDELGVEPATTMGQLLRGASCEVEV